MSATCWQDVFAMLHTILVAGAFVLMILSPCLVALRTGLTGDGDYYDKEFD
jgi:hypothetical protein